MEGCCLSPSGLTCLRYFTPNPITSLLSPPCTFSRQFPCQAASLGCDWDALRTEQSLAGSTETRRNGQTSSTTCSALSAFASCLFGGGRNKMRFRVLLEVKKGTSVQGVNRGCSKALSSIKSLSPHPSLYLSWPQPQRVPAVGMQRPFKK